MFSSDPVRFLRSGPPYTVTQNPNTPEIERLLELPKGLRECASEITKATVPFYTVSEGNYCLERSGVLFRVGERHFIVTCAHDLKDRYKKYNLPAYLGALSADVESTRPIHLEDCQSIWIEKFGVDLAVIELTRDVVDKLLPTNQFIGITEMDLQAVAHPAIYLVLGFPSAHTRIDYTAHRIKTKNLWYLTMQYRGELNPNTVFNPTFHILLNFRRKGIGQDDGPSDVPHPSGLSGCGIWRLTNGETWDNWTPEDVKLVAIQHRYDKRDYVMGSWVRLAMQIVWDRYEDLRPAMQIVVPGQR